ncbi:unnamed protein product [Arctogadus glacialis]
MNPFYSLKHFKNYIYVQFVLHTTIKVEQYSEERAQGSTLRGDLGQYIYLQVSLDIRTELDSLTASSWPQCLVLINTAERQHGRLLTGATPDRSLRKQTAVMSSAHE